MGFINMITNCLCCFRTKLPESRLQFNNFVNPLYTNESDDDYIEDDDV